MYTNGHAGSLLDMLLTPVSSLFLSAAMEKKLDAVENELHLDKIRGDLIEKQIRIAYIGNDYRHEDEENQITFSVFSISNFGPVTIDTNVTFPETHINIGNTWKPFINAFQASRAGVYMSSAGVACRGGAPLRAAIVHTTPYGSQRVVSLTSGSTGEHGHANIVIMTVDVDDYVSVQLIPDHSSALISDPDYIYSTFSGPYLFS